MTVRSGFFNSINGDRAYNATDLNMPYNKLLTNGVIPDVSSALQVTASSGLMVAVQPGNGIFGDGWAHNDAAVTLNLQPAHAVLNRIDLVVMRRDDNEEVRDTNLFVLTGTPAAEPVAPTVERSAYIKEYALAEVYVAAGATQITQSAITDTRADTTRCGWCTSLIEQVDTSTLFAQWKAAYEENIAAFAAWYESIKAILADDESIAAQILTLTENKADRVRATVSLTAAGWSLQNGYYYQSAAVAGVTEYNVIMVSPTIGSMDNWAKYGVVCTAQAEGTLTFRATAAVAVDANILNLGGGMA